MSPLSPDNSKRKLTPPPSFLTPPNDGLPPLVDKSSTTGAGYEFGSNYGSSNGDSREHAEKEPSFPNFSTTTVPTVDVPLAESAPVTDDYTEFVAAPSEATDDLYDGEVEDEDDDAPFVLPEPTGLIPVGLTDYELEELSDPTAVNLSTPVANSEPITITASEEAGSVFGDVSRTLTVNEQPFFRWFKRVFIALAAVSLLLLGFSFIIKAPLEIGLGAIGAVWVLILAFSIPDAIIPYKKTKFNLADNTVHVGQKKNRPIGDITVGLLTARKKNIKLWLGFSDKKGDGFFVPLKSNKFVMKREDLLVLRTIIPHTSISTTGQGEVVADELVTNLNVSADQIITYLETLMVTGK